MNIFNRILISLPDFLFIFFFNIKVFLLRGQTKFSKDHEFFIACSNNLKIFFKSKKQANLAYSYGLKKRAYDIGNAYFLNTITFNNNDLVIDCGANVGDLILYFNLMDIDVQYVGFEPSPSEFSCLSKNVGIHSSYNIAFWNANTSLDFYIASSGADSSLIEPKYFDNIIKVNAVRIDSLYSNQKIKLFKLEAEGAEPEILIGAESILSNIEYISADLGFERGIDCDSTLVPVTNFLLERNFELLYLSHKRVNALFKNKKFNSYEKFS